MNTSRLPSPEAAAKTLLAGAELADELMAFGYDR